MSIARARLLIGGGSLLALSTTLLLLRQSQSTPPSLHAPASASARSDSSAAFPPAPASQTTRVARSDVTSAEPRAIEALLDAIPSQYAARSSRKPAPSAEVERLLVEHVGSPRAAKAVAALRAARVSLMGPEPSSAVASAITATAKADRPAARRYAALEALNLIRPNRRSSEVLAAFQGALDADEPALVSLALLALSQSGPAVEALPDEAMTSLTDDVLELLRHYDPGVRGRALALLAEIPALLAIPRRFEAAERALLDRDPYVRAQAADVLARCREPAAIHRLIQHVGDLALARYELGGFARLDGPTTVAHEVPGRKRVAEAALFAIASLSEMLDGSSRFLVSLGEGRHTDERVLEGARLARAWYAAQQPRIPTALEHGAAPLRTP